MSRTKSDSTWTFLNPLPGPNWYASTWGDGAGTFWLTGVPSLGHPAPIARSTDGGHTWALEDFTSRRNHTRIRGAPGGDPWVTGSEGLVIARHKGKWKRMRTGLKGWIHGLWCPSPETVYVSGADGVIASTRDAGRTWKLAEPVTDAALSDIVGDGAGAFVAVGAGGVILRSDGGERWEVVREPVRAENGVARTRLSALATVGPGCFLAGGDDTLLRSDDGGRTWRDASPKGLRSVTSVCVTASGWWFVGSLERIVRSDDRGATWHVEHTLTGDGHRWVYALHVEGDGRGFAVGPHNTGYVRAAG